MFEPGTEEVAKLEKKERPPAVSDKKPFLIHTAKEVYGYSSPCNISALLVSLSGLN